MTEHLIKHQVEDYCRQKLSVTELLSVSDHLAVCEFCRRQVERALSGDAAFFTLRSEVLSGETEAVSSEAPGHLTMEQMADHVDGVVGSEERQEIADHLTACQQCAMAVDDLRAFRNEVAPSLDREYRPASAPVTTESWWHRWIATLLLSGVLRSPALAFGSAMAALLLIVAVWLVWQMAQRKVPVPEIAKISPTPTTTATPTVSPSSTPESPTTSVIAELNDGMGQVSLDKDGKLSGAEQLSPAQQKLVKDALTSQHLEKSPLLNGLKRQESSLMGGGETGNQFSVKEPIGKVLLSDRPTFRWSELEGAISYVVEVYDESFNLVATSSPITGHSWTATSAFKRGGIYSWQVKAAKDGQSVTSPRPPAPQAKFRVLDQAKANEIAQARSSYASSHLTLGLLYAQAGLLDEAEQELRALQKANPNSTVVRQWLANLQAMRR